MKILLRKCVITIFLTLFSLLQVSGSFSSEQRMHDPVRLKVLLLPFLSFAPFFIGEEEKYFASQGLQVEFVKMTSSEAAIPALAQGDLDITGGNLRISSLNAMARDGRIKFVADKGYIALTSCPYYAFIARRILVETGKLKTSAQLKGMRISLSHGMATSEGYFIEKLLEGAGLTIRDVEIVNVPAAVQSEAMQKGTIDLAVGGEPWVTRMVHSGHGVLWMPVHQVVPDFQHDAIVYGPNLLNRNPDAGKRFMIAYLKSVRQYNQGKTKRNLEVISKQTGLDEEFLRKTCWPALRDNGQITIESVLRYQTWAMEKGFLNKEIPPNQFWDSRFIEHANSVLSSMTK